MVDWARERPSYRFLLSRPQFSISPAGLCRVRCARARRYSSRPLQLAVVERRRADKRMASKRSMGDSHNCSSETPPLRIGSLRAVSRRSRAWLSITPQGCRSPLVTVPLCVRSLRTVAKNSYSGVSKFLAWCVITCRVSVTSILSMTNSFSRTLAHVPLRAPEILSRHLYCSYLSLSRLYFGKLQFGFPSPCSLAHWISPSPDKHKSRFS